MMIKEYFKSSFKTNNNKEETKEAPTATTTTVVKYGSTEKWGIMDYFRLNSTLQHRIEERLFEFLKNKINLEFKYVHIKNGSQRIWTACANIDSSNTPIVLVHGLCGAIGLWVHNMEKLATLNPLFAFDLLGFGRSSRPKFDKDPVMAEKGFIDAIEEWRKQLGLEKMILIGHSFGGFLVTAYALQYPERVAGLVLVDTWGFTEKDDSVKRPIMIKVIHKISRFISPFSIVRVSGPFGGNLIRRYRPDIKIKFIALLGENADIIYDYIWHANREVPSGEDGFRSIADEVYFYAKQPMMKRIRELNTSIPVWFIHGKNSTVDFNVGTIVKTNQSESHHVSVKIIDDAGHHVHADQPDAFNKHAIEIINYLNSIN